MATLLEAGDRAFRWEGFPCDDERNSGWARDDIACLPERSLVTGRLRTCRLELIETHGIMPADNDLAVGL